VHTLFLRYLGLDPKMVHYFFNSGPVWSKEKEKVMERILEGLKEFRPGLYELIEEMEEYLETIRKKGRE
jgi:hypothetical protein